MVKEGDNLRNVSPISEKTRVDENGVTHYVFSKTMFKNPWYSFPDDELELFKKFIEGGSRAYPSDGNIPCDVVAKEAREILNQIVSCSENPDDRLCDVATEALKHGKKALVRGTLKLYLGKYTTRDWRRKRFTDDIDFWTFQVNILERTLKECGFKRNKKTGEFEKHVNWSNPKKNELRQEVLYAANNLNQLLDFGAGSYLEGSNLKEIFKKKIKRGHDVDLSDMINVAMVNDGKSGPHKDEWNDAWEAFEQAANQRNTRSTSNLISLCMHSYAIADYLQKVSKVIEKYNELILDEKEYSNEDIKRICWVSVHWQAFYKKNGPEETRKMLHEFNSEQKEEKIIQAKNLRKFASKLLNLLNSKYVYRKVKFEVE